MIGLRLTGFGPSVYTWVVRMALAEKGLEYEFEDVNPFSEEGRVAMQRLHPMSRVPVLEHYAFKIYETAAILGYLDDVFEDAQLMPRGAKARARVRQVLGLVDCYGYWPMVRQVFSHGVFRPRLGEEANADEIKQGLAASVPVLDALEEIAAGGLVLNGRDMTRADCHLGPMIDYFLMQSDGAEMLAERPALTAWFGAISQRPAFLATRPDLPVASESIA